MVDANQFYDELKKADSRDRIFSVSFYGENSHESLYSTMNLKKAAIYYSENYDKVNHFKIDFSSNPYGGCNFVTLSNLDELINYNNENNKYKKSNKMNEGIKQVIRINENQLRQIVTESVKKVINETSPERAAALSRGRRAQASGEKPISKAQQRLGTTSQQFTDKANAAGNKAADLWNKEYGISEPNYGMYMSHNNGTYSVNNYMNYSNADGRKLSTFTKYDPQTDVRTTHTKSIPSDSEKMYYGPDSPLGRDSEWDNETQNYVQTGGGRDWHKVARRMASNDRYLPYLNENQLRRIVNKSVKRVIKENLENTDVGEPPYSVWADGSFLQTGIQDYYEAEDFANSLNNREIYIIDGNGEEVFSSRYKG